uniref:Amine oxidase domain-containing protein n=1 Tax=Panagrolaimus sp. PS1159 TaxID=55785 RepID=A0AC35G8N3_9BILA
MLSKVLIHLNLITSLIIYCSSEFILKEQQQKQKQPKVAIIGAGVAGLSTANRFLEKGFQNFEVFEAETRTGGRVYPIKYSKFLSISALKQKNM